MDAHDVRAVHPAVKAATNARGLAVGEPREPLTALDPQTADRIRELAQALGAPSASNR